MGADKSLLFYLSIQDFDVALDAVHGGGVLTESVVTVRELVAWGLDEYSHRDSGADLTKSGLFDRCKCAKQTLIERADYEPCSALLSLETARIQHLLNVHAQRAELLREYKELDWTLGVVDIRRLLAFQRRLTFDHESQMSQIPQQQDWPALLSFAFGLARDTTYKMSVHEIDGQLSGITLRSCNPDLQLRSLADSGPDGSLPFSLFGGSPFFEVAELRGRWFLRDGYHRAYRLLRAGVNHIPAVVIRARTIDDVGATQPWFLSDEQLFSSHPPRVTDFLEDGLVIQYQRPRLVKTISIRVEESLEIFRTAEEGRGEKQ
jgi:hypothetical protein